MKQFCKDNSLKLINELSHRQFKDNESVNNYFFMCLSSLDIQTFDHEIDLNEFFLNLHQKTKKKWT